MEHEARGRHGAPSASTLGATPRGGGAVAPVLRRQDGLAAQEAVLAPRAERGTVQRTTAGERAALLATRRRELHGAMRELLGAQTAELRRFDRQRWQRRYADEVYLPTFEQVGSWVDFFTPEEHEAMGFADLAESIVRLPAAERNVQFGGKVLADQDHELGQDAARRWNEIIHPAYEALDRDEQALADGFATTRLVAIARGENDGLRKHVESARLAMSAALDAHRAENQLAFEAFEARLRLFMSTHPRRSQ